MYMSGSVHVSSAEHAALYGKLRSALLSRHFALNKYFRTNTFFFENTLESKDEAEDLCKKDSGVQLKERWRIYDHSGENPLLLGAKLLTCLAIEHALGHVEALKIIRPALKSLGTLYKFRGNHFDGYIIRWDPVTSDRWTTAGKDGMKKPLYCAEFLVDGNNDKYLYCCPSNDPRHYPLKSVEQNKREEYCRLYRRWEVSMDELVGLVTCYFMISQLVQDRDIQREVKIQVNKLADYLAEHSYILVRPCGGFTGRGASGILPALEFPFSRVFNRITGQSYFSRGDFKSAMEKGNVWKCLEGPIRTFSLAGVAATVATPFLSPLFTELGLRSLIMTGTPLNPVQIARSLAVYLHRDCFDVFDDCSAKEFAVAAALKELASVVNRFNIWVDGSAYLGGGPAAGFLPFIGLTGLDDPDLTVRDHYISWLAERRKHPILDQPGIGAKSAFASAVSVVLNSGPHEEQNLVSLLDEKYNVIHSNYCSPYSYRDADGFVGNDNLALMNKRDDITRNWTNTSELFDPGLDYMVSLALAWLHSKRQADVGSSITTTDFPSHIFQTSSWPAAAVPEIIINDNAITLPLNQIQSSPVPRIVNGEADLFLDNQIPQKSDVPAPILPKNTLQLLIDKWVTVRESDSDVDTGIILRNGDEYEFVEATGSIWAGVWLKDANGPGGWNNVDYDTKFPLHGGLDPQNAHPYCLLGKLHNYFFIGERRARERYFYFGEFSDCKLYLRVNDDTPGNGSGMFRCHIKVWGKPQSRRITCVKKNDIIESVGGIDSDGSVWTLSASEVILQIERGHSFFVENPEGDRVNVIVSVSKKGQKYIKTEADADEPNNLLALPSCL